MIDLKMCKIFLSHMWATTMDIKIIDFLCHNWITNILTLKKNFNEKFIQMSSKNVLCFFINYILWIIMYQQQQQKHM